VATRSWPTLVVELETCLVVVFILLEFPSPSRRIFIDSHLLPPLWFAFQFFNWYHSRFRYLLTLASLRSKDGVPGTGFASSALRWEELPDVAEADGSVPPWKGSDPLQCHGEHNLCSSCQLPCSRIEGHVRRQQQGGRLPVPCSVSIRI
jgi:hypothetical protein